ncbi:helix-turn-helix domain-containing protein [Streptomyces sp. 549]|uniref:PucR family transcriptional regulator n=1 Tax=Streptomyces sp. 549 TaxID=3049076 RepID=UPI0024C3A383|nr:helix-turn-helix domain-containing protein [Streptomyces sp. 549]MDK1474719.1 helix-turn-helix domain-containing protein [Streptomyces sp. 549]
MSDPFAAVPRPLAEEITAHMRRSLDDVIEEVEREVRHSVPEYSRPGDDTYTRNLRAGVVDALALFIERIDEPGRDWTSIAHSYQEIGRGEAVEGRSLDTLQAALRVGSRVAWRRMGVLADALELEPHVVAALGEAAMMHMHEIAEAASSGFAEEQLHSTGELQRRRKRLLDLLLADAPASPEAVRELAHAARWPLPRRVAVITFDAPAQPEDERLLLPAGVLVDTGARPPRLLLPGPPSGAAPGRPSVPVLRDRQVAIGPTVPLAEAADSLRWATRALNLVRRGLLPSGRGTVRCVDHLPTLLLYADEPLLRRLSHWRLAPLSSVPEPQRDRLAQTLLAWLQSGNSVGDVANQLHVHPQTVRYRLRQLEKLFGDRLRDPESRFTLEVALRAESVARPDEAGRPAARRLRSADP